MVNTKSAWHTSFPSTKPWVEHLAIPRFQECNWASINNLLPGTTLWINLILSTRKELVINPLLPGKVKKVRIARIAIVKIRPWLNHLCSCVACQLYEIIITWILIITWTISGPSKPQSTNPRMGLSGYSLILYEESFRFYWGYWLEPILGSILWGLEGS